MTRVAPILHIVGNVVTLFSFILLAPAAIDLVYAEGAAMPFVAAFTVTLLAGLLLRFFTVKPSELHLSDGFAVVTAMWLLLSLFGALPFYFSDAAGGLSFAGAWFESMSGLTTTGATVYSGLDSFPHAVLFFRHLLQWVGGLGIVVLAIAILPLLGVGGMQLYRIETTEISGEGKLTPRLSETAKILWAIYAGLTLVCALAYRFTGMNWFDAVCHSMSTISIGGFSTHDANIGHFDSGGVEAVAIFFMLISSLNYSLHFLAWRRRRLGVYKDAEAKVFFVIVAVIVACSVAHLLARDHFVAEEAWRFGVFQAVSITTTTGFTNTHFAAWAGALPMLLIVASAIGCCAGSMGGGVKVVRFWLLVKHCRRELFRLVHPNAQCSVKIGHKTVEEKILNSVWGFFAAYVLILVIGTLLLLFDGLELTGAFSAVAASLHNLGPGLGSVAHNYASVSDAGKTLLCFVMLLGRLEIFTLLVVLTPAFWRR